MLPHRIVVLDNGHTDLDRETVEKQEVLAELTASEAFEPGRKSRAQL